MEFTFGILVNSSDEVPLYQGKGRERAGGEFGERMPHVAYVCMTLCDFSIILMLLASYHLVIVYRSTNRI